MKEKAAAGKWDELISSRDEAVSGEDFYCVASAYMGKGQSKLALSYFLSHRESIWVWNPVLCMKYDIECRVAEGDLAGAYEDARYFENLPYISQEVEEALREIPNWIRKFQKPAPTNSEAPLNASEICSVLRHSTDAPTLLSYLNRIKKEDLSPYWAALHELLEKSEVDDDVKSYVLMLLSAHHDQTNVSFQKGGRKFTLVPAEVRMPFSAPLYSFIRQRISSYRDPSVSEIAGELLDQYALLVYPENIEETLSETSDAAFLDLALSYLGRPKSDLSTEILVLEKKIQETIEKNAKAE